MEGKTLVTVKKNFKNHFDALLDTSPASLATSTAKSYACCHWSSVWFVQAILKKRARRAWMTYESIKARVRLQKLKLTGGVIEAILLSSARWHTSLTKQPVT